MWDKDILKYNDCVGETMLDIGKFYRKAYHKNCAVNFFETAKGAAMDRMHKKRQMKAAIPDTEQDIPPDEDATEDQNSTIDGSEEKKTAPTPNKSQKNASFYLHFYPSLFPCHLSCLIHFYYLGQNCTWDWLH